MRPPSELDAVLRETKPDVVIDFSGADATAANAPVILRHADIVVGTTGFTPEQKAALEAAVRASGRGAVISPNMSIEMNVLFDIVAQVARMVPNADVAIHEEHHTRKKDAPSGSAKKLAECVGRDVQISSARLGNVVGKHTVSFVLANERLDFTHEAYSREAFADGALKAAEFVRGKKGVYSMADVIAGARQPPPSEKRN